VIRRVEQHMGTVVTLAADVADEAVVDRFFDRVRELEALLSSFRPDSDISRIVARTIEVDRADRAVREVLVRCDDLRRRTDGDFDHEPVPGALDVNALAKGWIIEEAATELRLRGVELFVNAGGDILTTPRPSGRPWRIGIQHPADPSAVLGVAELTRGAVATSGTYERGEHLRGRAGLTSVTVVGPDLAEADALSTAVFASGTHRPPWWDAVDRRYGLLTLDTGGCLRWAPPDDDEVVWRWPDGSDPQAVAPSSMASR
jgi:thiamine biosynthesis lipoprotein